VAPVVTAGEEQRKVYFPKGTWYDFWTDQPYSGPLTTAVEAPIDRIPIFVRAGAIIPTQQVVEYVDQAPLNPLTLEVYPEGSSTRPYYEDDGISFAYQRGGFLLQRFSVSQQGGEVRVQISAREGHYTPPARSLVLKVHGQPCLPRLVQVGGKTLEIQASPETLNRATEGAAYDAAGRIVWIKAPDQGVALEARIQQ
jgi:alpha-glucosidase